MWPLLKRDGLALQYFALTLFWNYSIGYNPLLLSRSFVKYFSLVVYVLVALLHLVEATAAPPAHLKDLFVVLNLTLCCGVFGLAWLWGLKRQLQEGWALGGLGFGSANVAGAGSTKGPGSVSNAGRNGGADPHRHKEIVDSAPTSRLSAKPSVLDGDHLPNAHSNAVGHQPAQRVMAPSKQGSYERDDERRRRRQEKEREREQALEPLGFSR